jgi:protein-tyrosine-phosphatase
MQETQVLFVCTYWGVRSQIAQLLMQSLNLAQVKIESAGLEVGKIGGLPRDLMRARGFELPDTSPATVFNRVREGTEYDYVITLCSHRSQENYAVLLDVVQQLFERSAKIIHWNIEDFMAIGGQGDARIASAEAIIESIENKVHALVAELKLVCDPVAE